MNGRRIRSGAVAAAWLLTATACASVPEPAPPVEAAPEPPAVSLGYWDDAEARDAEEVQRMLNEILGPAEPRTYWQYVDEDGVVRFTESLLEVPAEWRGRAGYIQLDVPPPSSIPEGRMIRKLRLERGAE